MLLVQLQWDEAQQLSSAGSGSIALRSWCGQSHCHAAPGAKLGPRLRGRTSLQPWMAGRRLKWFYPPAVAARSLAQRWAQCPEAHQSHRRRRQATPEPSSEAAVQQCCGAAARHPRLYLLDRHPHRPCLRVLPRSRPALPCSARASAPRPPGRKPRAQACGALHRASPWCS
jgi:hypothetical protein